MRKAAAMFMAAMMAVSLSGCTGGGKTADSTTAAVTEAKETTVEATTTADTTADSAETQKAAEAENEAEKSGESYHIAYLCPSMDTPFWRYMATGVEREAEKLGNVTVTTYDSKNSAKRKRRRNYSPYCRNCKGKRRSCSRSRKAEA